MSAPNPKLLKTALEELHHNHSFGVFVEWLKSAREEAVQTALNPNYTETLGVLNRAAGNIEAYDTVLGTIDVSKVNVDYSTQDTQDSSHAELAGSGSAQ